MDHYNVWFNNFCSYCIVPYVRRERSRQPSDIQMSRMTRSEGYKEAILLGQKNSYGKDRDNQYYFPNLLMDLDKIGIERIRFMTSHPKDLSEELFAMNHKVCEHPPTHPSGITEFSRL